MYTAHGWFELAESTEDTDTGNLRAAVDDLEARLQVFPSHTGFAHVHALNGSYFLVVQVFANRRRQEAEDVDALLDHLARTLPGSRGILYERDDETTAPPGPNAYRVRVLARGRITEREDPFLSPCNPVIED